MPLRREAVAGPAFTPGRNPTSEFPLPSAIGLAAAGGEADGGRETGIEPSLGRNAPVLKDGPKTASRQRGINAPAHPSLEPTEYSLIPVVPGTTESAALARN